MRFKLQATNEIGNSLSANYLQVLLAGIPNAPTNPVIKLASDKQKITVEMPIVTENAGSTLLQYDLHVDDGIQGEMTTYYVGLNRTVDVFT